MELSERVETLGAVASLQCLIPTLGWDHWSPRDSCYPRGLF